MKTLCLLFLLFLTTFDPMFAAAQEALRPEIARAAELNENGDYLAAKNLLEPLLQADGHALTRSQTGDAWNILGTAYTLLGENAKARQSFAAAIQLFKNDPSQARYYAAALDNLGSVEMQEGQLEASKTLRLKAKQLYERNNDSTGLARVDNNLALIALREGNFKQARKWIGQAFRQSALSPRFDMDSVAAMYSIRCTLEAHDKRWNEALNWAQQEIRVLQTRQDPESPLLADAYALRSQVYDGLGDYRHALDDLQNALTRFQKSPGPASPLYLSAELIYARVLRHSGLSYEASRVESQANTALTQIRRQQCSGCSVSVLSFH
jgi:tetratricopeptide (TPR) repeat protein